MSTQLSVRSVSAGYGSRAVLHDVTLPDLPAGSVTAVTGPNAAGKSTLMKVLAGMLPSSGKIELASENFLKLTPAKRARIVGYLPQSLPAGSSLLAYESVLGACRVTSDVTDDARIDAIFRLLDMEDIALTPVGELSGGKRQLVGLAQVLVRDPGLLLLDEPTSALDLRWQIEVLRIVRQIAEKTGAVVLVSVHDINLAMRFCDKIIVLSNGRLISAGTPTEAITPEILKVAWQIDARIERCSLGYPIVLADRSIIDEKVVPISRGTQEKKQQHASHTGKENT